MTNFTTDKILNMSELEIWKNLPTKGHMYIYDDCEELAIRLYITKGIIKCNFKRKGKREKMGDFTSAFIRESICYGKEITKEEYDKL